MKRIDVNNSDVEVRGLIDGYVRIPASVAEKLNETARAHYDNASGGRVRFATDSPVVEFKIKLTKPTTFAQFPLSTNSGVDVYIDGEYYSLYTPEDGDMTVGGRIYKYRTRNEIQINLPILNHVEDIEIFVDDEAQIFKATPYKYERPVVFYGSSITCGVAASRPGNTYPARLSRAVDFDFINIGFPGGCRGEIEVAEYIAGLDMSLFVLDYDHNAPKPDELKERHERFFKTIRAAHPDLPVLMISKPDLVNDPVKNTACRDVIYSNYSRAQAEGDENVWFIDGAWLYWNDIPRDRTADWIHPTDFGFKGFCDILSAPISMILEKTYYRKAD